MEYVSNYFPADASFTKYSLFVGPPVVVVLLVILLFIIIIIYLGVFFAELATVSVKAKVKCDLKICLTCRRRIRQNHRIVLFCTGSK